MCRNIKNLHNFDPPASNDEIHAAALQFVRKVSGSSKPSKVNEEVFNTAVNDIAAQVQVLLNSLQTNAPKRDREVEAAKAKARNAKRFSN